MSYRALRIASVLMLSGLSSTGTACVDRAVEEEFDAEAICGRFCERAVGVCGPERSSLYSYEQCMVDCQHEDLWRPECIELRVDAFECRHDLTCKEFRRSFIDVDDECDEFFYESPFCF